MHNNANKKQAYPWYNVTHDGNSRRITIPKKPINSYCLAFYGIIYQNLLCRWVYIAVSSQKLLLMNLVKKSLHITFNAEPRVSRGRGQELETETKFMASTPVWPQGFNITVYRY